MNFNIIIFIIIIVVIILFNSFTKNNKKIMISGFQNYHTTKWSSDLIKRFQKYQTTMNDNNNQFNLDQLQKQASPEEAEKYLKTGLWYWPDDLKKLYIESVWSNPMIKIEPQYALNYAMGLYNKNAVRELLAWNTKEGQFLLYGLKNGVKCSDDIKNPVLQKTTVNGYNLFNGFKNSETVDLAFNDIPNETPGFSFVNSPCNPCSALNDNPDYSCPFKLNVKGNDEISDVWKNLWSI